MNRIDRPVEPEVELAVLPSDSPDGVDAQISIDQQLQGLSCKLASLTESCIHSNETFALPLTQQHSQNSRNVAATDKIQNYYSNIDEAFFADSCGDRYSALNVGTLKGKGDVARELLSELHSQIGDVLSGQIESYASVPVANDLQAIMASLHASQNNDDDDPEPLQMTTPVESNRKLDLLNFSSFIIPETKSPQQPVTNCEARAASSQMHVQPWETKPRSDKERIESAVIPSGGNDEVKVIVPVPAIASPMESRASQPPTAEKNAQASEIGQTPISAEADPTKQNTKRKRLKMDSQSLLKSFDSEDLELPGPVASFIDQISLSNLAELNSLKAELESILKNPEPTSAQTNAQNGNQS